jgi:ribosomal protein S18 acetylase RimI-like enzyme
MLPIRPFDKNLDLRRVKDFFAQMGGESRGFFNRGGGNEKGTLGFFEPGSEERYRNMSYFMALDGERMAGYVFLWDLDKSIPWLGISVAEDWKGRHLGRDLMAHAENHARKNGKGGILLTTHAANVRGQSLYERCGYERMGTHTSGEFLYLRRF